MVDVLARHDVRWLAPAAMWSPEGMATAAGENGALGQPAILRFNTDLFMDELMAVTAYRPDRLPEWIARPETWREPMATPPTAATLRRLEPISSLSKRIEGIRSQRDDNAGNGSSPAYPAQPSDDLPFKLYQPAHQRYYLVTASLVCRVPGLPDRAVDGGRQEQVSFVVRRVVAPGSDPDTPPPPCDPRNASCEEYAYVATDRGFEWRKLAFDQRKATADGEERLPMFAVNHQQDSRKRRLLSGFIPVGKREAYLAAPPEEGSASTEGSGAVIGAATPRGLLFQADVAGPWKALVEQADFVRNGLLPGQLADDGGSAAQDTVRSTVEQIQTGSWYVLLDLARYLERYVEPVWDAILDPGKVGSLTAAESDVYDALESAELGTDLRDALSTTYTGYDIPETLTEALAKFDNSDLGKDLEDVEERFSLSTSPQDSWPDFLFPLAHPDVDVSVNPPGDPGGTLRGPVPDSGVDVGGMSPPDDALAQIDGLVALVEAIPPSPTAPVPELEPMRAPLADGEAWYVIRCVYERPNCGPFAPTVVSEPTQPFQMASFFDSDAPARPIRIPMPLDTSPAGLRKFKKNATLMVSDMLCGQIKGIRKLTLGDLVLSVLPWPFHKDLPSVGSTGPCKSSANTPIGMFCSLSIPIVTLCALILLIIMVALFDMFFRWIPYLFVCFPIPGLQGKK